MSVINRRTVSRWFVGWSQRVRGEVATVLGESGISINRMRQYDHEGDGAPVLIVTHRTSRDALDWALGAMDKTGVVESTPVAIRIEEV